MTVSPHFYVPNLRHVLGKFSLTFKESSTPSKRIENHPLSLQIIKRFSKRNALLITTRIFRKDVLEFLRHESSLRIISPRITPMLILMNPRRINPEEGIWEPARDGGIAEIGVNNEDTQDAEDDVVAKAMKAVECVEGPDHSVGISVEESDVLL